MDGQLVIAGVVFCGGVVVWAVRQEGRLNSHDDKHIQHDKRAQELQEQIAESRRETREDIGYIRDRIDSAINGRSR